MIDLKILDQLSQKFYDNLPPALKDAHSDLKGHVKSAMQSAFANMDLVTREEFDVQKKVLERSREKLEQMEKRLAELESK